jgi:carboxyl-terminal processing protease
MKLNRQSLAIVLGIFILGFIAGYFGSTLTNYPRSEPANIGPSSWAPFLNNKKLDVNLFEQVWQIAQTEYVKQPVNDKDLFYGSLRGIVSALKDPYSIFLDPTTATSFKQEINGSFEGIGIEIGIKNNQLTVVAPLPGTPADKAGLKAGDKIIGINRLDTTNMAVDYAATLIRGKGGTKVKLTIMRQGWTQPKDIEIVRAKIIIKTIEWEIKNNNVVYLKISHFDGTTGQDLAVAVKEIMTHNPQKMILDLRNNPGGYLDSAVDIAGYWLPNKTVVISKDAQKQAEVFKAGKHGQFADVKLIVLINGGSASAAEILAGALQDYQKGALVGETTFGKGSVQDLIDLPGGSSIKVTVAYWYTPKERQINDIGINPDIKVGLSSEDYNQNKDPQLDKALELLK